MNDGSVSAQIYSLISVITWGLSTFLSFTMANVQTFVSILGGLVAVVSGAISIYKNIKKP